MGIDFRILTTADDVAPLPEFEQFVWSSDERVSVNMLIAAIIEGGMAIAGYDGDLLVATGFGFATRDAHVLHSHYIAVHPDHRNRGVGEALKREQAAWCRANGYSAMRWTFDPLQLANAHLNLEKLGAYGITYHVNHYGTMGGINGSLPSDRLTVYWDLVGRRPDVDETVRVEVPMVAPEQISSGAPEAVSARLALRDAMVPLLAGGWIVTGVSRHDRAYLLGRPVEWKTRQP